MWCIFLAFVLVQQDRLMLLIVGSSQSLGLFKKKLLQICERLKVEVCKVNILQEMSKLPMEKNLEIERAESLYRN